MKGWERLNAAIIACQQCPRLVAYRQQVAQQKRQQFCDQTSLEQTHSRASVTETLASC